MIDRNIAEILPLNRFLKMAVIAGVESAIQIHIDRGDDLNARDGNGLTPLMLSAARNRFNICKLLLEAGVDASLLTPSGITAYGIAVEVGAHEAARILMPETRIAKTVSLACTLETVEPMQTSLSDTMPSEVMFSVEPAVTEADPDVEAEFDLSGWEPEEDTPPPEVDQSLVQAASTIQTSISKYEPVDSSEDWDDVELYLPDQSMPLARNGDTEARVQLRSLLLRATREGSVPAFSVEDLSLNNDKSINIEAVALLTMVINDLGAEVDERSEYTGLDENFKVFVCPDEKPDEEDTIDEALRFIDSLTSRYSEPLRIYQKEFQREKLISAGDEVILGKAMEGALEGALDALASWPLGIELTLTACKMIITGQKPLTWLAHGPAEPQPELEADGEAIVDIETIDHGSEEVDSTDNSRFEAALQHTDFASEFSDATDRLANLRVSTDHLEENRAEIREVLSSLKLNRRFLLELADIGIDNNHCSPAQVQFLRFMQTYISARETMTTANLKLVFHLAKKYLFSGEPLDDLAQEGNIGLMKAVERYDWRRGFKFSTYATWWIRQHIGRHVADKCRTIRVPVHIYEKTQRLTRETLAFETEFGRPPDLAELAARVDVSVRTMSALKSIAPEPLRIDDISIDEMIAIDAQPLFVSPHPSENVADTQVRDIVKKILATLKPKEEQVVRFRFGIGVSDSLTLEEVGQQYDVTRERIRQIEAKAIRALKNPSRINALSLVYFGHPYHIKMARENEVECVGDTSEFIEVTQLPIVVSTSPSVGVNSSEVEELKIQEILVSAANKLLDDHQAPPQGLVGQSTAIDLSIVKQLTIDRLPADETTKSKEQYQKLDQISLALTSTIDSPLSKRTRIDKILAQAKDLDVSFVDERRDGAGRVWVNLTATPDGRYRKLARNMLDLGFEFTPMKGYSK